MKTFTEFLTDLRDRVEPMEIDAALTWWDANIRSNEATEAAAGEAQKRLTRFFADRDSFAALKAYDEATLSEHERRQHHLLMNGFTANQMDDAAIVELVDLERRVESAFNQFRPVLRGESTGDNALRDILRTSTDVLLRRDAWEASKSVGAVVAADVLTLVQLRNREAKRLGYADYYQMALALQEIEPDLLFTILDDIAAQTDALYGLYKNGLDQELSERLKTPVSKLRPWHYGDPFFQEAPSGTVDIDRYFRRSDLEAITTRFYDDLGLEVRDILARSDLYEREGKCQHAFCVHIGRYEDVRILCNCVPSAQWMGTMLHECGHAVYDKYLDPSLPYFLREPSHILTTEAIAMLFGRLARDAGWLARYVGVDAEEAEAVAASAKREQSAQLLIMTRWCLVMSHFERAMYADPEQDLNRLWWELVSRFQGITLPVEERDSRPDWASKIHLAVSPVYYHNYLLGEMLASQLWDCLAHAEDTRDSAAAISFDRTTGDFLRTAIFARGARLPWNQLIEEATGKPLNASHFVAHIA